MTVFLSIVFYQIIILQGGQAKALWPRDTFSEYKMIIVIRTLQLRLGKHLSRLIMKPVSNMASAAII